MRLSLRGGGTGRGLHPLPSAIPLMGNNGLPSLNNAYRAPFVTSEIFSSASERSRSHSFTRAAPRS